MSEFANVAGPWGRSAITALLVFIALWFDPRISYIQRDISDNRDYIKSVDNLGTRKSQQEVEGLNQRTAENTRRIEQLEDQYKHIDATLTILLQRSAARDGKP